MSQRFFLTTAIDYVNGRPHLGHAYEKILADVMVRHRRSLGEEVFFLTGVDEHGQKVQQSAQKAGLTSQEFCDQTSALFRDLWARLGLSNDRFVRTTDQPHKDYVRACLQKLYDKGEIYFKEHEGFYSARAEQFVTEKDQVDGVWPEIYGEVVKTKEPNYFFKLAAYQDWLRQYVTDHPEFIFPSFRRNEVLAALENPIGDLCISRPKSRLEWGIPLPFAEDFVTYVWFDALINYVSFADPGLPTDKWPADVHLIGKDILIPAHAVYWPIMLKALGLEQPKQLVVHGWWMNRGAKMSKSVGNVVDPEPYIETFGPDALRYFVMREMSLGQDADFTDEKFIQRYQSDLGNDLGNLVQRSLSMIGRYREGSVPARPAEALTDLDRELESDEPTTLFREAMESKQIHIALQHLWAYLQKANQYVEQSAPWKLAKDPALAPRLDVVLATLAETVRRVAVLTASVLPHTSEKIYAVLNLPVTAESFRLTEAAFGNRLEGKPVQPPTPLFPRIEVEKEEGKKA
ncbi:methionine--tRNA ligase [Verrucomicrobium sp. GAS474]|uniref:methionine--tRNA ligase n=1 Tax=Verrucomicrobium sp. GAS474 TaxID=1882831 RepID=UPI000B82B561|nr:methionine--tRNA ligase [Verrucomicrobium sp. GAS474]